MSAAACASASPINQTGQAGEIPDGKSHLLLHVGAGPGGGGGEENEEATGNLEARTVAMAS